VANALVWLPVHHQIAKAAGIYKKNVCSQFSIHPDILLGINYHISRNTMRIFS
jgi:hypothetical protein